MKQNHTLLLAVFTILIAVASSYCVTRFFNTTSIVYFESHRLFQNFKMTKESRGILESEFKQRKNNVDSLNVLLQEATVGERKDYLLNQFLDQKEELENFMQNSEIDASQKIWLRINTYSKDFAEQNGYNLIFSTNEKESILYGSPHLEVTDELLNYINKRYEGSN